MVYAIYGAKKAINWLKDKSIGANNCYFCRILCMSIQTKAEQMLILINAGGKSSSTKALAKFDDKKTIFKMLAEIKKIPVKKFKLRSGIEYI